MAVGLDRPRRAEVAVACRPRFDALAGVLELVWEGAVDPFLEGASDLSPDGLRLAAAPLPTDVHLFLREGHTRLVAKRRRARDSRGAAPVGPVPVRRARVELRALQWLRPRLSAQVDQPR